MFNNKFRNLALAFFAVFAMHAVTHAAIINTPGLTGVRFWEATGPVVPFTFAKNSSEMTTQLGVGTLGPGNDDYFQLPSENYDVFYSDANGTFNLNGNHVTVEAVFPFPLPSGGGLNLSAVDLVFGSSTLRADILSSFVGLGNNYIAGSELLAVDADTPIPSTTTTMGNTVIQPAQHLRVTVTWSKLPVPEPASAVLALSAIACAMWRRGVPVKR